MPCLGKIHGKDARLTDDCDVVFFNSQTVEQSKKINIERMRVLLKAVFVIIIAMAACLPLGAQSGVEGLQNRIYAAYVSGDMVSWERTVKDMESLYSRQSTNSLLYDILLAQYGLIGYYLGTDQKSKASACLKSAEDNLKRLSQVRAYANTSRVFESAFLAFRISLQPLRAVQLGPRSYRLIDQAIEADPNYSRAWIEKANAAFYTPSMFGGNKVGSIEYYQKAIRLLENSMPNNHRWLYLSTLLALANAYAETGDLPNAIRTTEKALAFEPAFVWARDEVLPRYRNQARR